MLGLERTGWRGGRWLGMGVGVQWVSVTAVYTSHLFTPPCVYTPQRSYDSRCFEGLDVVEQFQVRRKLTLEFVWC